MRASGCANISSVPITAFPHTMRLITSLLLVALLGACGFKGPLALPKPTPQAQPAKPAPAPQTPQNTGKQDPSGQ